MTNALRAFKEKLYRWMNPAPPASGGISEAQMKSIAHIYKDPFPGADLNWYINASRKQSRIFYIDMFPYLTRLLTRLPRGSRLTLLDVGTASGAGAQLYGELFNDMFTGYQIDVTGIDLFPTYLEPAKILNPDMNYLVGDAFELPHKQYDIAMCSHTIEHIERDKIPGFIEKVNGLASAGTIFYCPWQEEKLLDGGHLTRIDEALMAELKPDWQEIIEKSMGWHHPHDSAHRCIMFGWNFAPSGQSS